MVKQIKPNDGNRTSGNEKFFFKGNSLYGYASEVYAEDVESPLWFSDEQVKELFEFIEESDYGIYKKQFNQVANLFGYSSLEIERYKHEYISDAAIIDGTVYDISEIKDISNFLTSKNILPCLAKKVADSILSQRKRYKQLIKTEKKLILLCRKVYTRQELYLAEERKWKLYNDYEYSLVWNGYFDKAEKKLHQRAKRIRGRISESEIERIKLKGFKPCIIRVPRKIIH